MASNDKPFALICGGEVNYLKVPAGIRGEFENLYQVAYLPYVGSCDKPEVLRKWLRDHLKHHRRGPAVAVCFDDAFDAEVLAAYAAAGLLAICRTGSGYGTIRDDLMGQGGNGVGLYTAPGCNKEALAEFCLGTTLNLLHGITKGTQAVEAGLWPGNKHYAAIPTLHDHALLGRSRVLILGAGHSGLATALKLSQHTDVVVYNRKNRKLDPARNAAIRAHDAWLKQAPGGRTGSISRIYDDGLVAALKEASVVSLHLAWTSELTQWFNWKLMRHLRRAWFINTARGLLVDEADLLRALREGKLLGAHLDVRAEEPSGRDNITRHKLIHCTPHSGWTAGTGEMIGAALLNAVAFYKGEPIENKVIVACSLARPWAG